MSSLYQQKWVDLVILSTITQIESYCRQDLDNLFDKVHIIHLSLPFIKFYVLRNFSRPWFLYSLDLNLGTW